MKSPGSEPWTVRRLIRWGSEWLEKHGIDQPRLDVELLLADAICLNRMGLYLDMDRPLDKVELAGFKSRIKRRSQREPVAYILGKRDFWKQSFSVDSAVLIPRPETETLIDSVLTLYPDHGATFTILDIGVGSGAILYSLLGEFPRTSGFGVDLSAEALRVAEKNRDQLNLKDRVTLFNGDLTAPLPKNQSYSLIVSNPPYIESSELEQLQPEVVEQEPRLALDGGEDGLDIYRRLIPQTFPLLNQSGWLVVEIGYNQGKSVAALFAEAGYKQVAIVKDYGKRDRVVIGTK
ncbi:MAG: peptide chain release factor N(5)-glutamine methyltransferase [Magnetococcales bacterium]|nr:peptide chain release factor N(5)-glutamine methyltransferase [Magnetococcales bacterium]